MRGLASLAVVEERSSSWDDWSMARSWRPAAGGPQVNQWTAFNLSAVWACETLIADAVATLPVDTYRKKADSRVETVPPGWLDTPNPENNRIDYETQRMLSLLGWGNAYSFLVRQHATSDPMDPVVERWLLDPSAVSVRRVHPPNESSKLEYRLRGELIDLGNMQHIRGYVPPGQFLGMSVISQAANGLGLAASAELAGANLFNQGMSQSGVLEIPQLPAEVSKDVVDRIRDSVAERNSGPANAGKPLVLTGGTKWNPAMMTPADAQYVESRKFQINEICRWFRVPPHKIADIVAHASQGGGMGIEQQATEFAQDTLLSWVNRLEIADSALLPRGQYVKYNLNAYVRADLATQIQSFTQGILNGWYDIDDVLALMDRPPLPDGKGKVRLRPANYVPIDTPVSAVSGVTGQGAA